VTYLAIIDIFHFNRGQSRSYFDPQEEIKYWPKCHLDSIQELLLFFNTAIKMLHWCPKPNRENDYCLMDVAIQFTKNKTNLQSINEVRITTKTIFTSDVFTMDGLDLQSNCYEAK